MGPPPKGQRGYYCGYSTARIERDYKKFEDQGGRRFQEGNVQRDVDLALGDTSEKKKNQEEKQALATQQVAAESTENIGVLQTISNLVARIAECVCGEQPVAETAKPKEPVAMGPHIAPAITQAGLPFGGIPAGQGASQRQTPPVGYEAVSATSRPLPVRLESTAPAVNLAAKEKAAEDPSKSARPAEQREPLPRIQSHADPIETADVVRERRERAKQESKKRVEEHTKQAKAQGRVVPREPLKPISLDAREVNFGPNQLSQTATAFENAQRTAQRAGGFPGPKSPPASTVAVPAPATPTVDEKVVQKGVSRGLQESPTAGDQLQTPPPTPPKQAKAAAGNLKEMLEEGAKTIGTILSESIADSAVAFVAAATDKEKWASAGEAFANRARANLEATKIDIQAQMGPITVTLSDNGMLQRLESNLVQTLTSVIKSEIDKQFNTDGSRPEFPPGP